MVNFASDNVTGACPEVLQAVIDANESGPRMPYGNDAATQAIEARLGDVFDTEVKVLLVATGTAANSLALAALTPPWGAVYCHEEAHIQNSECGAPELFSGGAKLMPLAGPQGKLEAATLEAAIDRSGSVHHSQPAALSLTQSTEAGTLYRPAEISALTQVARGAGLHVHMDGARFANAVAALQCHPADITWKAGVDALSFGGTKNGCLAAEAVVFFRPELAENAAFLRKRTGHLFSKMRLLTAQFEGYLTDDAWLRHARHANAMATRLAEGLEKVPGIALHYPVESNQVFARFPRAVTQKLQAQGFQFYAEMHEGASRLVTAWSTRDEEVDAFLDATRAAADEAAA
ncbi:threonine aldolase family protein [Aquibaculum arenosum]|uniref:threonine aldolase family protein n=1 Tax=Aquibaculum arenosum TaxID=3032591 RepID=UPI002AC3542F|nr:low specificity L-threonine aldolase [Fodinicurvata sp. CAU 1616]